MYESCGNRTRHSGSPSGRDVPDMGMSFFKSQLGCLNRGGDTMGSLGKTRGRFERDQAYCIVELYIEYSVI